MTSSNSNANSSSGGVLSQTYTPISTLLSFIMQQLYLYSSKAKSFVYDTVILRMTEKWYRCVLDKLDNGSIILDVGVGTGGALLRCTDLIEAKDLKVVGIDIDSAYVEAGKIYVEQAGLSDRISIDEVNVYEDREKILELARKLGATPNSNGEFVDAVYFSGSFSLLPDPVKALQLVSKYVKGGDNNDNADKGKVYITQTYQRRTPFFLPYLKPLMKYATTIDFGQLVREEEVLHTFKQSSLEVVQHEVIPGSVDNTFQAAYLSVLR